MCLLQTLNYHIHMIEKYLDVCMYRICNRTLHNNLTGCYMKIIEYLQGINENNLNYYSQ